MLSGKVKKVFSVRQKKWPPMRGVYLRVQDSDGGRFSSAGIDLTDAAAEVRRKHDLIVLAPATTARICHVTEFHGRATVCGNALQLGQSKEADGLAVRRPERVRRSLCAIQRHRAQPVDGTYPQGLDVVRSR